MQEPQSHGDLIRATPEARFVGRYKTIKTLGVGGMGTVLEVFDTLVGRTVALKVMHDQARQRQSMVRRFQGEYRVMARLHHAGIPRVHDAGVDEHGTLYFTMELVRGRSLATAIDEGVDASRRLKIAAEVAEMLVKVHQAGIIHRDVKPGNILVGDDNRLYLVDFGASHVVEADDARMEISSLRTAPGTWLGTPGYVDPAMLLGFPCSPRSDVYSLAATIAWMFTGAHPGAAADAPIPTTGIEAVDRLLRRGMAKDPGDRPATAADFLVEITAAEASLSPSPSGGREPGACGGAPARKFAPGLMLALGVLGGVLGGPVGGALLTDSAPPAQQLSVYSTREAEPSSAPSPSMTHRDDARAAPRSPPPPRAETPPKKVQVYRRPQRQGQSPGSTVFHSSWVSAVRASRPKIADCLNRTDSGAATHRVSVMIDGNSGRFRRILPIQVTGQAKKCLQKELGALEFERFPGTIKLTLGLP